MAKQETTPVSETLADLSTRIANIREEVKEITASLDWVDEAEGEDG